MTTSVPLALRTGFMPQLDAVRGIAILLVIIEHLGGPMVRTHFPLAAGGLGVNLFFVMSGFLISGILFAELDRPDRHTAHLFGRFYFRRAVRLIPAYYLVLAVLAWADVAEVLRDLGWHLSYSSNFLIAAGGPLLPFWSLSVEEQFYLILPFLLLLVSMRHRVRLGMGLIAAGFTLRCLAFAAGIFHTGFEVSLLGSLEVLGTGVLLGALCYCNGQRVFTSLSGRGGRIFGWAALTALAVELVIFYTTPIDGAARFLTFPLACSLFLGWPVVFAARGFNGLVGRVLLHPALRYVGRISYTLYLTHAFLPSLLQKPQLEAVIGRLPLPILALASLVLSFIVATLSWFLLERPLLRIAHRLTRARASLVVAHVMIPSPSSERSR